MQDKHITYFNVLDAFDSAECPVCHLINKNVENYFDSLIYENINNYSFVTNFDEDSGFCDYHTYKFFSYNDGLAIALTYKDIIMKKREELEKNKLKLFVKNNNADCIICELIKESENRYINIFNEFMGEEEFKQKFLASKGLCVPHLKLLIKEVKKIPEDIIRFHINNYKKLERTLIKYIDSRNVSLGKKRPILKTNEEKIAKQVINMIYGSKNSLHY